MIFPDASLKLPCKLLFPWTLNNAVDYSDLYLVPLSAVLYIQILNESGVTSGI